jgi:O-antigen/teichoic acid export membrane protein
VGSIFILLIFDKSVLAFFSWQLICSLAELTCAMYIAWSTQGTQFFKARFDLIRLRENWKFASGVVTVTLTAAAVAQLDKVILSKILTLEQFGYYALGATVAYGLFNLVYPICVAASPRFTGLLQSGESIQLSANYHLFAQLCTVLAMPVALILMFYGTEILTLYLRNYEQALKVEPFLSLITLGTSVAILSPLPHTLQIASGRTVLISTCNIVFALLYTCILLLVTPTEGVEMTIKIWILLNCVYLITLAWFMHRRLLVGEFWQWLSRDICVPALLGFAVAYLTHDALQNFVMHPLIKIGLCYIVVLAVVTSGCLHVRRVVFDRVAFFFIDN